MQGAAIGLFEKPHRFWSPWHTPELWLTFVSGPLPTLLHFLQDDEPVRNELLRIPTNCFKQKRLLRDQP